MDTHDEMLRLLPKLESTLHAFAKSSASFELVRSVGTPQALSPSSKRPTLLVLDFSANPPSLAHFQIALSSVPTNNTCRLLLLLATQNADKAPKPAAFSDRLAMMSIFASELVSAPSLTPGQLVVEIGIIKHARFLDKSTELEKYYPDEQVFLIGYDTLIRLLDTKYYPTAYTLGPLAAFFEKNRIKCTYRLDDGWGIREEQDAYLKALEDGEKDKEGAKREWATRVEMVQNRTRAPVSSTKVREAVRNGEHELLDRYVTKGVKRWIIERKLYYGDEDE